MDVNLFRGDINFQTAIVTYFRYRFFFHFDIDQHQGATNTSYKISNIPSRSGENNDFNSIAIFSNGGHLEFSTRLNFTILKS